MTPEIKQRWIDALRSGEYEQGTKQLERNGKHCVFGVLAETCDVPKEVGKYPHYDTWFDFGGKISTDEPPPGFQGLDENQIQQLVRMNDGTGGIRPHTFHELSLYIKWNIPAEAEASR